MSSVWKPRVWLTVACIGFVVIHAGGVGTVSAAGPKIGDASVHEGDVATFTVHMNGHDTVRVQVGRDGARYRANLTINAGWDENTVHIRMNTFKAGGWTGASADEVFSARDGSVSASRSTRPLDSPIEPANYRIYAYTGDDPSGIGILSVKERGTHELSISTAPKNTNTGKLRKVKKRAIDTTDIAEGDIIVAKVNATGLNGYISSIQDIEQGTYGVSMEMTYKEPNAREKTVDLGASNFYQQGSDTYVILDAGEDQFKPDTQYDVAFKIDGDKNPYVKEGVVEKLSGSFKILPREIEFEQHPTVVEAKNNEPIELSTTVAPGTKFSFTAVSESVDNTFVMETSATVTEGRTVRPKFNFGGVTGKTGFTITIEGEGVKQQGYVGGEPKQETTEYSTTNNGNNDSSTTTTSSSKEESTTTVTTRNAEQTQTTTAQSSTEGSNSTTATTTQSGNSSAGNGSENPTVSQPGNGSVQQNSQSASGSGGVVGMIQGWFGAAFSTLGVNGMAFVFSLGAAAIIYKLA